MDRENSKSLMNENKPSPIYDGSRTAFSENNLSIYKNDSLFSILEDHISLLSVSTTLSISDATTNTDYSTSSPKVLANSLSYSISQDDVHLDKKLETALPFCIPAPLPQSS